MLYFTKQLKLEKVISLIIIEPIKLRDFRNKYTKNQGHINNGRKR